MRPSNIKTRNRNRKQRGYTLLEYAAGAALLMGILYVGLKAMGTSVENLLGAVGGFADSRAAEIQNVK